MKLRSFMLFAATMCIAINASAQKMDLEKGSFKALSGQKVVNVVFTYEDMNVGTGKNEKKESEYIEEKVTEYNVDEPGRGDAWHIAWIADRDMDFERKFLELFNDNSEDLGMKLEENNAEAEYTLLVNTTMTEPGFSIPMVMTKNAAINLEIKLVETGSEDAMAVLNVLGAPGRAFSGAAWDTGIRIQEAYAKAAKTFAKWLPKKGMK